MPQAGDFNSLKISLSVQPIDALESNVRVFFTITILSAQCYRFKRKSCGLAVLNTKKCLKTKTAILKTVLMVLLMNCEGSILI